jgi:hypothetical protein
MDEDLRRLLPATKYEVEKAEALVALGHERVLSVMPAVLEWTQDSNWPVAQVLQPFLAAIGSPLAPFVREILAEGDDVWKYFLLLHVVAKSTDLANSLRDDLERLVTNPTDGEVKEEVSLVAKGILDALN